MKTDMLTTERRAFGEVRASDDDKDKMPEITGYAAKFDSLSEFIGGWRERIVSGAFSNVLGDDVRALVNHDGIPLARTSSRTLTIGQDRIGLWFSFTPADTPLARDVISAIRRGDLTQASFQFQVASNDWDWIEDEQHGVVREIRNFRRLLDVSIVSFPAYPETEVDAVVRRSFDSREAPGKPGHLDTTRRLMEALRSR
jgi:HK97 family phage prohead protease